MTLPRGHLSYIAGQTALCFSSRDLTVLNIGKCNDIFGGVYYDFSAGIGRTGTFLAVDYLLEQAKAEGVVDVVKYTDLMRSNRMNMIQTPVSLWHVV